MQVGDSEERLRREVLRRLPAVHAVLEQAAAKRLVELYGHDAVVVQVRSSLATVRSRLGEGVEPVLGNGEMVDRLEEIVADVEERLLETWGEPARRVLNATGVFLHTNLGRAPLAPAVLRELPGLLSAATDVEFDLQTGRRGDRSRRSARLLCGLTGAEDAIVVNNNAAALVLILAHLTGRRDGVPGDGAGRAASRQVVVSRGELVEIGGSFRIPDILAAAGADLVEVGTTNRTRVDDYRRAIGAETAAILRVHPSNFRIRGFTQAPRVDELAALGAETGVPLVVDEGSGLLRPSRRPALREHESVQTLLAAGADLVCGSGDKVLGGPQAGLIFGRGALVTELRRHPLYRVLRPSRQILVTLEETLRLHLRGAPLPLDRLWDDREELESRLESLVQRYAEFGAKVEAAVGYVGGGAAPDEAVEGPALTLPGDDALAERLRLGSGTACSVVGYLRRDRLWIDLRTVDPGDDGELCQALDRALGLPVRRSTVRREGPRGD